MPEPFQLWHFLVSFNPLFTELETALKRLVLTALVLVAVALGNGTARAKSKTALSNAQLVSLTENGITLKLGGKGEGYEGSPKLSANGTGKGKAKTDSGQSISISGTWRIVGDQFCRTWADLDGGKEVCATWVVTSGRSVEVFNGEQPIGVNSWSRSEGR